MTAGPSADPGSVHEMGLGWDINSSSKRPTARAELSLVPCREFECTYERVREAARAVAGLSVEREEKPILDSFMKYMIQ